jgi:hypothetical protein
MGKRSPATNPYRLAGCAGAKVLDLKARLRYRRCGRNGRAVVSIKWRVPEGRQPMRQ